MASSNSVEEGCSRSKKKQKQLGKYCVAGGPGNVSCKNSSLTEGISMHGFPKAEGKMTNLWRKFVQKHRPNWKPSSYSALCSAHFEPHCFTQRQDIIVNMEDNFKGKRWLDRENAYPTIDTVVHEQPTRIVSARERRQILRHSQSVDSCLPAPATTCVKDLQNERKSGTFTDECCFSTPTSSLVKSKDCESAKEINEYKECLRKSKERNAQLRKKLFNERSEKRNLMKSLQTQSNENCEIEECSMETIRSVQPVESDTETIESDGEIDECHPKDDLEWDVLELKADETNNGDDGEMLSDETSSRNTICVPPNTKCQDEPKFIVFHSALLTLFSLFCFKCKTEKPKVKMHQNGTMVTVFQSCASCGGESFKWRSQPFVFGRYPAGNVLLSFAILMAGASVSKILLVFRHMGISAYTSRTYFYHQSRFIFPTILLHWETYQSTLIESLKGIKESVWCGDGRFDSMGHSAKFGVYTMFCTTIMKIVHFDLLQANQTGNSNSMELEGAKLCFDFLLTIAGLTIPVFVSDRHRGVAKWLRETHPTIENFFDQWHIAKSIVKKMVAASKEKGCERIGKWTKAVRNHIYWCSTSSIKGFSNLILAKWKSFMRHVANKHDHHLHPLFPKCAHEELENRKWTKVGTRSYDKLQAIIMKKSILNDVKKLSPDAQTSSLEGFHSTLNQWHPKMICFSWLGTYCRHILATLHFNENVKRQTKTTKDGKNYVNITYPKFKFGEEVVRNIAEPPTYIYVANMKHVLFSTPEEKLNSMKQKYKAKVPDPLNTQFPNKTPRDDAIKNRNARKRRVAEFFPSGENQAEQMAKEAVAHQPQTKRSRCCKKCKLPMKGHPRSHCPVDIPE